MDLLQEYRELKQTLDYHMDRYYNQDAPEISDYEYDQLMLRLKAIEKEHPDWIEADSPSQKIGGTAKREAGVKVTHAVPMLSIEDVFDLESVDAWVRKVQAVYPDCTMSVETKIDGLSMSLRYVNNGEGQLILNLAETRGDGFIGEDVTENARVIPDVPSVIPGDWDSLEVRGEVYMSHEDFERFNEKQEALGKKTAANPRNLAAGTLRQLDPTITRERGLRFFVFNIQSGPAELMEDHIRGLEMLAERGVPVVLHSRCKSTEEIRIQIQKIADDRENYPFDIDGAVIKLSEVAYRDSFPAGSKYSSGHIAYKYPPEERVIEMEEVLVDVGRTGKLTFTALFHDAETGKPARLCGTAVSRATLHNQDYITGMHIGIGGHYKLYKSGEIIPRLNGCVKEPAEIWQAPSTCPVCGGELVREEDTADIRCINPSCPAQLSRTIAYFASLDCMNIMGFGETLADALARAGYLKSYADIYRLKEHREELIEAGIIGKVKNTDKVLAAIEASKENEPARLLAALGIRNVGRNTARDLMRHYDDLESLMQASEEELTAIQDIGATTAHCIVEFFADEKNQAVMAALKDAGVNMKNPEQTEGGNALAGLTIVVTGTLPTLGRKEAEALIVNNGGKCSGSVSKKTSYLVAGEAAGSKLQKAESLGIPVIDEEMLFALIDGK